MVTVQQALERLGAREVLHDMYCSKTNTEVCAWVWVCPCVLTHSPVMTNILLLPPTIPAESSHTLRQALAACHSFLHSCSGHVCFPDVKSCCFPMWLGVVSCIPCNAPGLHWCLSLSTGGSIQEDDSVSPSSGAGPPLEAVLFHQQGLTEVKQAD